MKTCLSENQKLFQSIFKSHKIHFLKIISSKLYDNFNHIQTQKIHNILFVSTENTHKLSKLHMNSLHKKKALKGG